MHIQGTLVFNLQPDGSAVTQGDHAPGASLESSDIDQATGGPVAVNVPFGATEVVTTRSAVGDYRISGPGITWPAGYRVSVYKDENDENTIRVKLGTVGGDLQVLCSDPDTGEACDIIYLLTVRVAISGEVTYSLPTVDLQADQGAEDVAES
jgi:hypothetical protein